MFEIQDNRTAKVKIYGTEYAVKRPTYGAIVAVQESIEGSTPKGQADAIKKVLVDSGLPSQLIDEMLASDIIELFHYLSGDKKK